MQSRPMYMNEKLDKSIRAARCTVLRAKTWETEAVLSMLGNNLDTEAALRLDELIVISGTGRADRLERVLNSDPDFGIFRHVDLCYPEAIDFAKKKKVNIPGVL